jgi:N-acetylmuramoyl-L-alanine amidase
VILFRAAALTAAWISSLAGAAPLVAIDVGHSTANPGAISAHGRPEFEFNVDLARSIRQALAERGAASVLVGEDGAMEHLSRRNQAALEAGATFFLSVHHDSAQAQLLDTWTWQGSEQRFTDQIAGYSLFVSRKNLQPAASLRCARGIGLALRRAGLSPTSHHAARIAGEFKQWADRGAGVYYYDELVVLKSANTPAVLLEAGIILNRNEELALQDPARQSMIAAAVAAGLDQCRAIGRQQR